MALNAVSGISHDFQTFVAAALAALQDVRLQTGGHQKPERQPLQILSF